MRGVRKHFGATTALDGVDVSVRAGTVRALVGENGAGKSTLMKVLSGALAPDAGEMRLDGEPFAPAGPLDARRRGVAMIYQELSLADRLSVEENLFLGIEETRGGFVLRRRARERAREALAQLGHADLPIDARAGDLSAGERQVVEIARAVVSGCRVLVLDEPTSSLGRPDAERLFALIRRLRGQGLAIVYISHFIEEVKQVADTFTVLRDGRSVGEGDTASASAGDIVAMMVGRRVDDLYRRRRRAGAERPAGEPLLEVRGLAGAVKPVCADLELRRGEVLGLAGLIGAGRTELFRAVFGLDPVRQGTVRVGAYTGPASPARRWAQGVGLLSEDRKTEGLATALSVAENLTLSRLPGLRARGPLAWIVPPSLQARAAAAWADRLGVRCRDVGQRVGDLSGGNQQKVALARLLHHDVDVLLLDEPTRGIDVGSKAEIYRLIEDLAARGKAVVLISSYLPELLGVCDRIAVMCRGRLGEARPAHACTEHSLMSEATGAAA
jgi:ribose transport system ATP-binding protein